MKTLTALFAFSALATVAGMAQARDLAPAEILQLHDAGSILAFDRLDALALAQYRGGKIEESELEEEYGRYVYQVEVRDPQGLKWDLELDAGSGEVLKNRQDD
ncbi:PepSY domain-containing protein [Pseudomonas benzenivorans]|uniref:PepSY domain-containing protein n=1 Tax=Pseudomonas benzenivorans TaxID=556533 RepID=A0ABZ0PRX5_9PSED|nr:PepSY domain-containing protein [Pseudomonas benzenivorans]WPC03264.1 PepSY domain-containing protein [Pseudomonas benzenivorans]